MWCYNAVIADARMPTATDIQARCSILSPELALPSGSHSTTTRSHGALHVLGTPRPHQSESLHCLSIPLCHSVVPVATIPVASLLCKTFLIVIIIHFHFSDKIHSDINVNQVLQHCWDLSFYTWVDNSGLTKIIKTEDCKKLLMMDRKRNPE